MVSAVTLVMAVMTSAASQMVSSVTSQLDPSCTEAPTTVLDPSATGLLDPAPPLTLTFATTMFLSTYNMLLTSAGNSANSLTSAGNAITGLSTPFDNASVALTPTASAMFDVSAITPTTVSDMMASSISVSLSTTAATTPKPAATPTARPPVSTTPDPTRDVACLSGSRRRLAPKASDATFQVLVGGVLIYTCNPGFKQMSGSVLIRCGGFGWVPKQGRLHLNGPPDVIVCKAIEFEKPTPPPPVPGWLVPLVTAAAVLLAVLVLSTLMLFLYVRSGAPFSKRTVHPWQPDSQQAPAKKTEGRRGWPWKRPWQSRRPARPPGHLGPDGVAWFISDDFAIFPVKR